jgi:hypothetical protein
MKKTNTAFITLSDLHVGSDVGLWPPDYRTIEKQIPKPQSEFQEWLWTCWLQIPATIKGLAPKANRRILVINGDVIEGIHHHSPEIMVATRADMDAALKLVLAPLRGMFHGFLLTKGTECHSALSEIGLGSHLGPNCMGVMDKLRVRHNEVNLQWRHHMSTTSRIHTEGTALRNEWVQEAAEAARCRYPAPDILTMAHRHVPDLLLNGQTIIGVTGPWQGLTRYGHKVARHGVAKPSMLIYDFSGKGRGELPEARQHVWVPELQASEIVHV